MAASSPSNDNIKVAILDVETTGLNPIEDRVIQIAILILDGRDRPLKLYESYFNPGLDVLKFHHSSKAYQIHQIHADVLKRSPLFEAKANEFLDILNEVEIVVGHNILFDFDFVRSELQRIGQNKRESESDDSWQAVKENNVFKDESEMVQKFDSLRFRMIDTLRLALVGLPFQASYSLPALTEKFGIQVEKFKVAGYKWRSDKDNTETVLNVEEQSDKMKEHNAITDVMMTEKLLKQCLSNLKISYIDIIEGKCQKFEISRKLILAANKLLEKEVHTDDELIQLVKLAPEHINVHLHKRGKLLREMKPSDIIQLIYFLSSQNSLADRRQKIVCKGFLQLFLKEEELKEGNKEINKKRKIEEPSDVKSSKKEREVEDWNHSESGAEKEANEKTAEVDKNGTEAVSNAQVNEKQPELTLRDCGNKQGQGSQYKVNENQAKLGASQGNSYKDETEEYEISRESYHKIASLAEASYEGSESSCTEDSAMQMQCSQNAGSSRADSEEVCSESILQKV